MFISDFEAQTGSLELPFYAELLDFGFIAKNVHT